MKSSVMIALILAAALISGAGRAAEERFPELRIAGAPPEGFRFVFADGPDFYLWYCQPRNTSERADSSGFGIYFGTAPQPVKPGGHEEPGTVAGLPVVWSETHSGSYIRKETHLSYKHGPSYITLTLHVFVHAKSTRQCDTLLATLRDIRFTEK